MLVWLAALLLAASTLRAQPVASLDAVWCLGDAGAPPLLEVNLMLQRASLDWRPDDGGLGAAWRARLTLERGAAVVVDTSWTGADWRPLDRGLAASEKLPVQVRLPLAGEGGRLRLRLSHAAGGAETEKGLRLPPAPSEGVSDILPGVARPEPATEGPFRRGGWRFLPYADALYGSGLDTLHALWEVRSARPADSLTLGVAVLGERRNRLESRLPRPLSSHLLLPGDPLRVAVAQPVTHLPSGSYQLELTLEGDGPPRRALRPFWVHNPGVERPAETLDETGLDAASPEELGRQWEAAQALAGHHEADAWERMDLEERRSFLVEFWRRRDPDPSTLVNELQATLLSRLEEAKARYPDGDADGLGDRAKVFLRHGPPDAVETDFQQLAARFQLEMDDAGGAAGADHRDFELWIYHRLDGGCEFIFIDQRGFGTFELVHSTKSGEYYDPSWTRKLFP